MASIKIACTVFVFFFLGLVACQDDGVAVAEGPKQVSFGDLFGALGGLMKAVAPEEDHEELQGQLDEMTGLLDGIGISAPISSQETESQDQTDEMSETFEHLSSAQETDCVEEVEKNTDYNGGDLFEYSDDAHEVVVANSNNKMADSEEECRDICKAAAACNYWTFVKNWAVKCLLKTYIENKETKKGIVSGNVCREGYSEPSKSKTNNIKKIIAGKEESKLKKNVEAVTNRFDMDDVFGHWDGFDRRKRSLSEDALSSLPIIAKSTPIESLEKRTRSQN